MNLLNPIGLLGLIGIPILILIYIIKSKYQEYTISSTFIWELSEKFVTKKSPISKLSGILSLILQILIVLFLSLTLAHPILSIPNSARNYVFVVDNSASMHINNRISLAKEKMLEMVNEAKQDSEFTIVLAGAEGITLCLKQTDKEKVIQVINNLKITTLSTSISNGLAVAQSYFDEDNSLNVYLFTDIRYAYTNNIEVINFENQEYNAAVHSLYYTTLEDTLRFSGTMTSYNIDEDLTLDLYLDGQLSTSLDINCKADEETIFNMEVSLQEFKEAKVSIRQEDDLLLDNDYILYGNESVDNYKVLLASDEPFYLKQVLGVIGNVSITTIGKGKYTNQSGYDLYIFDGAAPTTLPSDGSIWLFNVNQNISNSGFISQGSSEIEGGVKLSLTKENDDIYNKITQHMLGNKISVSKFVNYTLVSSMTTILSYENYPIVFAGNNPSGNREIVFAFDLHHSDLPLLFDYAILFNNMIKYSLPSICDQTQFSCGDNLKINLLPNCEYVRINAPDGYSTYLTAEEYRLDKIGIYEIEAMVNEILKTYKIYVTFPENEQNPISEQESVEIIGEKNNMAFNSTHDIQWYLLIALMILCLLEWEVYVYEQRKVR